MRKNILKKWRVVRVPAGRSMHNILSWLRASRDRKKNLNFLFCFLKQWHERRGPRRSHEDRLGPSTMTADYVILLIVLLLLLLLLYYTVAILRVCSCLLLASTVSSFVSGMPHLQISI